MYGCKPCERERARWRGKLSLYGLSKADYEVMLASQQGQCATCSHEPEGQDELLDVDHDHLTNQNRGLLCRPCNLVLGMVRDEPDRLRRLASYLDEHTLP
jgi:hypothetical protein